MSCYAVQGARCFATGRDFYAQRSVSDLIEVDLVRAMRQSPTEVAQADAIYHLTVKPVGSWTIDTTVPGGRVTRGLSGDSDCNFVLSEETLHKLIDRTLSPEWAVISGQLRVSNLGAARRLANIITKVMT